VEGWHARESPGRGSPGVPERICPGDASRPELAQGETFVDSPSSLKLTLLRQDSPLASAAEQRRILEEATTLPGFAATLGQQGTPALQAGLLEILQVNVGKLCNQTCQHCHVDAGPDRREIMSRETMEACLAAARQARITTVDLTGGAPEMNPHFRWFVAALRSEGCRVLDRCNLTILEAPGYQDLADFLAAQRVEVVASLPCYLEENTDRQRGSGVFSRSIAALRRLNKLGYGQPGSDLRLTLVYNPVGLSLPPDQQRLEQDYHRELEARHGIRFHRLLTITNMPISRFLEDLLQRGQFEAYMQRLVAAFNPATVAGLMCRHTLSVDWQGNLYDCDFNQMLEMGLVGGMPANIRDFDAERLTGRAIATGRHCFGCTAGAGSGCQGAITV
jgi:radical SAM/Cys-rich protein